MYEEDRQKALAMYNRLFDECTNEQGLLQMLASPTRQAVLVARAYDAKERKLQVSSTARDEGEVSTGVPAFVTVIDKLFAAAEEKGLFTAAGAAAEAKSNSVEDENQMSFFDDAAPAAKPAEAEAIPAAEAQAPSQELPAEMPAAVEMPAEAEAEPAAEEQNAAEEPAPVMQPAEELPTVQDEQPAAEASEPSAEDELDEFMKTFSADSAEEEKPQDVAEEEPVFYIPEADVEAVPVSSRKRKIRKPMAGWLVIFILFAIPVGVAGILLLCVPALASLVVSGGLAAVGVLAVKAILSSGFIVMADILLILGVALIIFALGLLFLWLFVWFIGGAMVGLVRGLISLGGKWCYKEVSVNE